MKEIPMNRIIGAGCCFACGFASLGGTLLKDSVPYSGLIGWSLSVTFLFCAAYFFGKQTTKK